MAVTCNFDCKALDPPDHYGMNERNFDELKKMTSILAKQEGKLSNSTEMEYINPDPFSTGSL